MVASVACQEPLAAEPPVRVIGVCEKALAPGRRQKRITEATPVLSAAFTVMLTDLAAVGQ